ncbi:hypothetical protein AYL99_01997 [Fonsecaea erecta]|uniref:Phosphoribosyltransferase domain-containing protein n=1 Tax=Fonsecaea erecta TaxID=1367422 RepID=A0A178ZSG7_9EURO|nr:hypothetical protein AYL99_01997 [Fonsecaea erecta]OAP62770.1 hypothetical protein AYL99_01997 [Fonsecaea erecta]
MSGGKHIDFKNCPIGRPAVVGIYGLSGSGKTFVLNALRQISSHDYILTEGSEVISKLTRGGLEAFQASDELQKRSTRELAMQTIVADCLNDGKTAIVTGHFMLWSSTDERCISVWTQQDLETYTHIIYLNTAVETIRDRRLHDTTKDRPDLSVDQLRQWQRDEEMQLRLVCYQNGIIYHAIGQERAAPKVAELLTVFLHRDQNSHRREAEELLDGIIGSPTRPIVSALVLDADKTLSAADSGHLFWQSVNQREAPSVKKDHLKTIFGGPLGYTSAAFLQAALLYEELVDQNTYSDICTEVAAQISLYPEVAALLMKLQTDKQAVSMVVTCGLRLVWEKVLRRHGLFDTIKVIGSGPLTGAQVITSQVKASLVARLQQHHHLHVVAVGDGVLDLDMLARADRAVVIVGDDKTRSRRMEGELAQAINEGRFSAFQAVLARGASPRLNTIILPLIDLNGPEFWNGIFPGYSAPLLNIIHFTDSRISKILATPMRDVANSGPSLRDAHGRTGRYLALQTLPDLLGIEEHMIQHVQGHSFAGTRIAQQDRTLIVALMRGGEPMALGVSEILPAASFLHAHRADDVKSEHVDAISTIILVDSVVNSGQTVIDFVRRLEILNAAARIVIMAGVVQNEAVAKLEALKTTTHHQRIHLIALRFSNNKFTGRGGTDTGNRLYQTIRLE